MKLGKSYVLRRIIGYLQKLLYTVNRIRMSPTPTLNVYLFEGPIVLRNEKFLRKTRYDRSKTPP
jgi:hypothetical protein